MKKTGVRSQESEEKQLLKSALNLTRGEISDLITALDVAIEFNEMSIDSELPKGSSYNDDDKEKAAEWNQDL